MRKFPAPISLMAVLAILALSVARPSRAQCSAIAIGPSSVSMMPSNPFQAVRTSTRIPPPDPNHLLSRLMKPVLIARDSQGRVRFDYTSGELHMDTGPAAGTTIEDHNIMICDPVKGDLIQLDTANRVATLRRLVSLPWKASTNTPSAYCRVPSDPKNSPNWVVEDLGHRNIEGFDAVGWRITTQFPVPSSNPNSTFQHIRETWCSEDLAAVLLEITSGTENGPKEEVALTQIQRIEPDASLFEIPSDYTVSDRVQSPRFAGSGIVQAPPPVIH
jgi:hypothetical protein